MLKKLNNALFGVDIDIKERLFRIILVVGIAAVSFAILQGLTLVSSDGLMGIYAIMLASFVIASIATFKFKQIEFASMLIGFVIIVVALPFIFFRGGGINSGSALWLTLGIFYVYLMFNGKKLVFFGLLTVLIDVACYVYAYYNPSIIVELATEFEIHFDSIFAVIVVGTTIGIISKFQLRVFEQEREINLAQREELEILSKSKDSFFAAMSHEIRTPINAIIGLNELIMRENPSKEVQEYAHNIKGASKMLLSLVNDILDLSQLEVKRMELVEKEYNTHDMLCEIIDVIKVPLTDKRLKFFLEIDENLPSELLGDDRRIKQVAINLLTNAVKYTESGSVTLRVGFEKIEEEVVQLKITVADTGIGIRKEELDFLFDAFRRADVKKNHTIEGTGLGLSIVKQLMDLMGGDVTVDSIYTQGSIFTVTMKQTIVNEYPIGKFVAEAEDEASGVYYSKSFEAPDARVLVIDDDDLNLIITTKLLADTKMSIDTACSPDEALRKTKKRQYNLILLDYMMPGMNGGELLKEIRKQENGLCTESPVVLLSANVYADKQSEYLRMGFDGLLEKPIDVKLLEEEALKHIPEEFITYRSDAAIKMQSDQLVSRLLAKKRKKIYVASDSVCDVPREFIEKFDIKLIDLYIKTEYGRFQDSKEVDIKNMSLYLSENDSTAYSLSPLVEDYEKFFAELLTEAEEVIYISMAKGAGKCFENATAAARGFDHVHVIDSGHISAGQGLVVLHAAQLAMKDATIYHIAEEIEIIKHKIQSSYILPNTHILYKKGFIRRITAQFCDTLRLHPVLSTVNSKVSLVNVRSGSLENAWKSIIRHNLLNHRRINNDVIFVAHGACSVHQQEIIRKEIERYGRFKNIIFVQGSVASVCNSGLESIGFAIYRK